MRGWLSHDWLKARARYEGRSMAGEILASMRQARHQESHEAKIMGDLAATKTCLDHAQTRKEQA